MRRFWTSEEDALLAEWYARPIHAPGFLSELASLLGRSRASVALHASRLGLADQRAKKSPGTRAERDRAKYKSTARYTPIERRAVQSERMKTWIAKNGHPRGATGITFSAESRAKISAASRRAWQNPASGLHTEDLRQRKSDALIDRIKAGTMPRGEEVYSRTKSGRRADLENRYFRSAWEANYARYLNWRKGLGHIVEWEYEVQTFWFEKIKRGTRSYTPDFKVIYPDGHYEWHEVKGWMDSVSRTRLDRMQRYFPHETLRVIDKDWFANAKKTGLSGLIPHWEGR